MRWVADGRQRAVVVSGFDDLSEAQVAQVLDCTVGTIEGAIAKAVARFATVPGWPSY